MIRKEMIAMLLAGGQGSRLGVLTAKVAKPAVAFGGKSVSYTHLTEAVTAANDSMGVVIGDNLQYVWKRSRKSAQPALPDIAVGAEDARCV